MLRSLGWRHGGTVLLLALLACGGGGDGGSGPGPTSVSGNVTDPSGDVDTLDAVGLYVVGADDSLTIDFDMTPGTPLPPSSLLYLAIDSDHDAGTGDSTLGIDHFLYLRLSPDVADVYAVPSGVKVGSVAGLRWVGNKIGVAIPVGLITRAGSLPRVRAVRVWGATLVDVSGNLVVYDDLTPTTPVDVQ